jgi:quercetin dioxygenase-like cupin family protein
LPRVLVNTGADLDASDVTGAAWKLQARDRDLDSNVVVLPPGDGIDAHTGPDLDVLIHVIAGSGHLTTELGTVELVPGALLWLPRRARRQFSAGPDGLRYLTVHKRRQALVLEAPARKAAS